MHLMHQFSTQAIVRPCLIAFILLQALAHGDTPPNTASPDASQTQGTPIQPVPNTFEVLRQRQVQAGGHSITYNLITPPSLPAPATPVATAPTPAELASAQKPHQTLALGATVFDHLVTDLHWVRGGSSFHVFSNIDFNDFAGVGSFETADAVYNLIFMIGNQRMAPQITPNSQQPLGGVPALPDASQFPQGQSGLIVPAGFPTADNDPASFSALAALNSYYDANRTALHQAAEAGRAANRAREQWIQAHPSTPQPTVIHLWKVQTNAQSTSGGANP